MARPAADPAIGIPTRVVRAGLRVVEAPFRFLWQAWADHALPWLRGAYMTLRYVDGWGEFPAIQFEGRRPRLVIVKEKGARLVLGGPLLLRNNMPGKRAHSSIHLRRDSRMTVRGPMHIGDDVRIVLAPRAVFESEGASPSPYGGPTYAGFQGQCVVLVKQSLIFGKDVGVSWRCEIQDSDWHPVGSDRVEAFPIVLEDHVWITPGAKVLKGAHLGKDCIVGRDALVIGGTYPPKSFIAGIPAKRKGDAPDWRYEWHPSEWN